MSGVLHHSVHCFPLALTSETLDAGKFYQVALFFFSFVNIFRSAKSNQLARLFSHYCQKFCAYESFALPNRSIRTSKCICLRAFFREFTPWLFNALHDSKRLQYLWVPASWEAHSSHLKKKKKTDPYNLLSVEPLLVPQCVSVRVPWRNRSDGMSMYLSVLQPAVQIV